MPEEAETQEQQEEQAILSKTDLKALRDAADRGKKLGDVERELTMTKAGINTDSALGKMFFKSYDGDMTKEAITTAAQEIGLVEKTTTDPAITEEEKTATRERQTVANGAGAPDGNTTHPKDEAKAKAEDIIKQGGRYEDAAAGYIGTLVKKYGEGDKRAAVDKSRFNQ